MKSIYTTLLLLLSFCITNAQMIVTSDKVIDNVTAHGTAVLELRSTNKGILLPSVSEATVPIQNPKEGLLLYNKHPSKKKLMLATDNTFIVNFEMDDAGDLIKKTRNLVAIGTAPANSNTFYGNASHNLNDALDNTWINLNTSLTITPTKASNSTLINVEGMAQINSNSNSQMTFLIGVFVDNKLKILKKFTSTETGSCLWKKFELTGILKDLPTQGQSVAVYAKNISSTNNNRIYYGGASSVCSNINNFTARTLLAAQVTQ